jgi:hypothetical protein
MQNYKDLDPQQQVYAIQVFILAQIKVNFLFWNGKVAHVFFKLKLLFGILSATNTYSSCKQISMWREGQT